MRRRLVSFAAAGLAALLAASPAVAGECPAAQVRAGVDLQGPTAPQGVTDTVIGEIDLGPQYKVDGRKFRMRRLEIKPGGVVPMHAHGERPAHIYVIKGKIVEHRSTCAQPIVHRAGDIAVEAGELAHWWKNESRSTVVLISADVLPPAASAEETM